MTLIREVRSVFGNNFLLLLPWVKRPWIPDVGLGATAVVACIAVAIQVLNQVLQVRVDWYFNEYGLGALFGNLGLAAAVCCLTLVGERKLRMQSAFTYAVAGIAMFSLGIGLATLLLSLVSARIHIPGSAGLIIWFVLLAVAAVPAFRCGKALSGLKSIFAGTVVALATLAGIGVLPFVPLVDSEVNFARTDLIHFVRLAFPSAPASVAENNAPPKVDWEKVFVSQPELVSASVAKILPSDPSQPHAYFIGMAPYAGQKIFERELKASLQIFEQHFNAAGKSVILQNADDTRDKFPLATVTNLQLVAEGLASKIDKANDIVVLFITSHGSKGLLSVDNYPLPLNNIEPQDIRYALSLTGARNRVVIISACYSGSFIESLSDENTAVVTAADADHTSFGCSNDREWTYFTNAFFNHGLRQSRDLNTAFEIAAQLVKKWETKMKIVESHPQIFVGEEVGRVWKKMMPNFDQATSVPLATPEDAL